MSGDKYIITDQHDCYFLTLTVIKWVDLFTRREYRDILVNSLNYCVEHKGLKLYAWVIMTNHVHLVAECGAPHRMSDFLRDFKKFTSKQLIETVQEIPESRREWLEDRFSFEARRTRRAKNYKIWRDDNHAINLSEYQINIMEKIDYVHNNPVVMGWVDEATHYPYSSAVDYAGTRGKVKVVVI